MGRSIVKIFVVRCRLVQLNHSVLIKHNGGRGSVVRASAFESEDSGFDPLAGRVTRRLSTSDIEIS